MSDPTPTTRMPIVTLFESYGSGAGQVATKVAERLGVPYLGQAYSSESIEDAAAQQEPEEDGPFWNWLKSFGLETTDHLDNILIPSDRMEEQKAVAENTRTVLELERTGGVVLGRNGTVILGNNPMALHVKLDGALEQRVARAAQEAGIDQARAARRQQSEDQVRAQMSMRLYNWDPRLNDRYDLVINTGRLDLETAVDIIVAASKAKTAKVTTG